MPVFFLVAFIPEIRSAYLGAAAQGAGKGKAAAGKGRTDRTGTANQARTVRPVRDFLTTHALRANRGDVPHRAHRYDVPLKPGAHGSGTYFSGSSQFCETPGNFLSQTELLCSVVARLFFDLTVDTIFSINICFILYFPLLSKTLPVFFYPFFTPPCFRITFKGKKWRTPPPSRKALGIRIPGRIVPPASRRPSGGRGRR